MLYYKRSNATIDKSNIHYPFGMGMQGRSFSIQGRYRYGFNTQEKEPELGEGVTSAEFWVYDGKLGRRWNVDPVIKVWESRYAVFANSPIFLIDPQGDDAVPANQRKYNRSMRRYGRIFNRIQSNNPRLTNQQIHTQIENRYNNRRWMWIKMKEDEDGGGTSSSEHSSYVHIGDEYQIANPNNAGNAFQTPVVNLNQTGSVFQNSPQVGNFPPSGNTFTINFNGAPSANINVQTNVFGNGTWTLLICQDNNPGNAAPGGALTNYNLNGTTTILRPVQVSATNNLSTTITINANSGQNIHFVYINLIAGGNGMNAAPPAPVLTVNPPRRRPYKVISEKGNRNTDRLNRKTRQRLRNERN